MVYKTRDIYHRLFAIGLLSLAMLIARTTANAHLLSIGSVVQNVSPADSVAADSVVKTKDLNELVVEASNIIRRGNMESYIITKDMRKGSRTAGELLRKINGMYYHPFSEALTYLGSSSVILLVDSLQKDESYIKRQSPDRFDRIDVVPQPSGKYTGYDVLINFHTKPNYVGMEINVRENVTVMPDGNNGKGNDFAKNNTYADGTYMMNKLTITALGNWSWTRSGTSRYTKTDYPMSDYSETQLERDRKDPKTIQNMNSLGANLAADYKFNDRHKISFQWQIMPWTQKKTNEYLLNVLDKGVEETIGLHTQTDAKDNLLNSFALNYLGRFGQWNLDVSANYNFNRWKSYYNLEQTDNYNLLYDRKDRYHYFTGGFDLNRFFEGYKWYLGFSNYVYVTDFREKDYITDNLLAENTLVYDNLYVTGRYTPSQTLSVTMNGGITAYSNKTADIHKTTISPRLQVYGNFSPSTKFLLHAGWTMHTGTPSLAQLNDYGQFLSKFKYQEGNPNLKPQTSQILNLSLSFWRKFGVYGVYEFSNAGIFNIYTDGSIILDNGERFNYASGKYQNGKRKVLTLGTNFRHQFSQYFSLNLDAKAVRYYAAYQNYKNKVWTPSGSMNLWYSLERYDFAASLTYNFIGTGYVSPQVYMKSLEDEFMIGVQKGFFKSRLTCALSWVPPLHIAKGDYKYRLNSPNMIQVGWGNEQFRRNNRLEFTAAFRFSTGKQVRKVTLRTQHASVGSQF